MQLYLLRHAQSESNARWAKNPGESFHFPDPGLTPTGQKQAAAVAKALARQKKRGGSQEHDPWNHGGFGITHIYTSLMQRAVETAYPVSEKLGLPMLGRTDLHEWGGIYEWDPEENERTGLAGANQTHFESNFPQLVLPPDFNPEGWWNRPHESDNHVPLRARRVLDNLTGNHRNTSDRVLVVTHGGFINHLISTVTRLTPERTQKNLDENLWFVMNNTGLTRIDIKPTSTLIVYHNRIDHLPKKLIT